MKVSSTTSKENGLSRILIKDGEILEWELRKEEIRWKGMDFDLKRRSFRFMEAREFQKKIRSPM
jgi:hypothetical protein